ncbi:MAG: hypothetical protein ACFE0P_10025 [Oceanicaulis sp.]
MAVSVSALLGVLAALLGGQPEPAASDGEPAASEGAPDPCRFGRHGPAARLTLDVPAPDYPGYGGEAPPLTVDDACGLRFLDLGGVWESDGVQFIASHDVRTGDFALRFMHVPYNDARFRVWGFRFGDPSAFGRIGPDAEAMELYANLRFPTRLRGVCPQEGERQDRVHALVLDYDPEGRPRIGLTRMHSTLDVAPCRVRHEYFVDGGYVRLDLGAEG